jgi:hypothetical protein
MFGCGNYPAFPAILRSIEQECEANLARLRHHPSIVIYAGNNEDYQVQESFGLTYDYEDKDPESWLKTDFPARYIYEKVSARAPSNRVRSPDEGSGSSCPMSLLPKVRMCHTILAVLGETVCVPPIKRSVTCTNGTVRNVPLTRNAEEAANRLRQYGMVPKKSTKSSTRWAGGSTANSAWRRFLILTLSSTTAQTRRNCILSRICSTSTIKPTAMNEGLQRTWWRISERRLI